MNPKRKGAIRHPRNLRIGQSFHRFKLQYVKDDNEKLLSKERHVKLGGEIRYQLRIQRYIEWVVTLTRKLSKFQV